MEYTQEEMIVDEVVGEYYSQVEYAGDCDEESVIRAIIARFQSMIEPAPEKGEQDG